MTQSPALSVDSNLSRRNSVTNDFSVSPDSAWLATAMSAPKNRGSICPQLALGAVRLIGDRRIAGEIQRWQLQPARCAPRATGASPANSSVSLSSQVALPISRGLSATLVPPVAFAGNGASSAVRTLTMKLRFLTSSTTSSLEHQAALFGQHARVSAVARSAEFQRHAIVALGQPHGKFRGGIRLRSRSRVRRRTRDDRRRFRPS